MLASLAGARPEPTALRAQLGNRHFDCLTDSIAMPWGRTDGEPSSQIEFWKQAKAMPADWIFDPAPPSGSKTGGLANAQVFDPTLDSFVREVLQNSRDQKLDEHPSARVKLVLRELQGADLDRFLDGMQWAQLQPHLEGAIASAGVTIMERLKAGLKQVEVGPLRILTIEDRNTRGLTGDENDDESNFNLLSRHELVTPSERRESGGSFGIGKSVLWRYSLLSTVLFGSWLSDHNRMRFFGRSLLTSHTANGFNWEGSGWLGEREALPPGDRAISIFGDAAHKIADATYVDREAEDPGTSIVVIGFDEPAHEGERAVADVCSDMVDSAVRWFWPALHDQSLEVLVEGWSAGELDFEKAAHVPTPETKPFFEAATGTPDPDGTLDATGEIVERKLTLNVPGQRETDNIKGPLSAQEASVRLRIRHAESGEEDFRDCVALRRGAGMVVQYREARRAHPNIAFHATLEGGLAHGNSPSDHAAEQFLRAAEPPAHERWTHATERIKAEYRSGAKSALDSLFRQIDEAIKLASRVEDVETDEAPDLLMRLFPLPGRGPVDPKPRFHLGSAGTTIAGDHWLFEGKFSRLEAAANPWSFVIALSVDQEGGGGREMIPIAELTAEAAGVSGPDSSGRYEVAVPADVSHVQFRGRTGEAPALPSSGLGKVRLRMDIRANNTAAGR
jgi:hypothetical protein